MIRTADSAIKGRRVLSVPTKITDLGTVLEVFDYFGKLIPLLQAF